MSKKCFNVFVAKTDGIHVREIVTLRGEVKMTAVLIALITIAVLFLIASGLFFKDDKDITDLSDDKKQKIDKLVDDYYAKSINGKSKNLKPLIEKEIANKIKSNGDLMDKESKKALEKFDNKLQIMDQKVEDNISKIDDAGQSKLIEIENAGKKVVAGIDNTGATRLNELDRRTDSKIAEIDDHSSVLIANIEKNRDDIDATYKSILEKEKELKRTLNLIDEYKKGLESLKAELDAKSVELAAAPVRSAAPEEAEEVEGAAEDVEAAEAVEAVEEAAEEIAEEAEDAAEEVIGDTEELAEDVEAAEEAVEEEVEEAEESNVISMADRLSRAADDEEEDIDEDTAEDLEEEAEELAEEVEEAENIDEFFEDDEVEKEDISDLEKTESLDEILAVEGINLEGGDTEENVMDMYHAGFSILEISKLLDLGVGEVKFFIDKHQGE